MISRLRRDEGLTTAELIVAMAVGIVLGAMTLALILGLNRVSSEAIDRSESATTARAALESWRDLLSVRESPAFDEFETPSVEAIDRTSIVFYASINNRQATGPATAPTKIEIRVEDSGLVERRYEPTGDGYAEEPTITRHLAEAASLSFTAYSTDGHAMPLPMNDDERAADRTMISRVDVSLTVIDDAGGSHSFKAPHAS